MKKIGVGMGLLFAMMFGSSGPIFADAIYWGCNYQAQTLRAGRLTCDQEVKECNKMKISCRWDDKILFAVEDFADAVAASEDGKYVVGLSNRGSPHAFWIRDAQGKLLYSKPHSVGAPKESIHYCLASVTNVREWFDAKNPDVKFRFAGGQLSDVTVRECDGKEVSLIKMAL